MTFIHAITIGWRAFFLGSMVGLAVFPSHADDGIVNQTDVYVFWQVGCPHCAREQDFLERLIAREPRIRVHELEVSRNAVNMAAFRAIVDNAGIANPGVPLTVVGATVISGFNDAGTTGAEIEAKARACLSVPCRDLVQPLLTATRSASTAEPRMLQVEREPRPLRLPLFGEINPGQVPLPLLTIMLGAVDGFNPCAMWTLLFLISLLVGLRDRFRMWVLGSAFIVASAAVYYLFMVAWLKLLLYLGMAVWIRLLIGVLALAGGAFYVHEYMVNPKSICRVTAPESRRRVLDRLRGLAVEGNFLLALGGIVLLAVVVNAVELACSAGLPAVYTQVLALNHLPVWQYHAYLALYLLVFMLDDLFVFFVAMRTNKASP